MLKIYEKILEKWLKITTEAQFEKAARLQDNMFIFKLLVEKNNDNMYICGFYRHREGFRLYITGSDLGKLQ